MLPSRTLISSTAIGLACLLLPGPAIASAQASGTHHHKRAHICKKTHRKHKKQHCAHSGRKHKSTTQAQPVSSVFAAAEDSTRGTSSAPATSVQPRSSVNLQQLLATPCQNTQLTPEASNLAQIREATLCLVNQERARNNEQPLQPNSDLERAAEGHSQDMIANDYFEHVTPSGVGPAERIQATGYIPNNEVGWQIGENIAYGTFTNSENRATPQAIVEAWIHSPEHLENILESSYQDSGIGVVPQVPSAFANGQSGATYTQDFGVIEN